MSFFVYVHTCPNGKKYVGQTSQTKPEYRWKNGEGYKHNPHFYRAIKKYGWGNIDHYVFKTKSTSLMNFWEKILIYHYKSKDPDYGYNMTEGGEGSIGRIPWNKGKTICEETRLKISATLKGKIIPEEVREKISKSKKGTCYGGPPKGRPLSEEHRKKLSDARKLYLLNKKSII